MSSVIERLRPRSLRQRVILGYAALVFVLFGILSLVTYGIQANTLDKQVQTSIQTEAGVVRAALHRQMTGNGFASPLTIPEIDAYTAPGITVEIVDCANALRYTSP